VYIRWILRQDYRHPNSAFYQDFLQLEEQANPEGMIYVITG